VSPDNAAAARRNLLKYWAWGGKGNSPAACEGPQAG
jgi:hypothetical protein